MDWIALNTALSEDLAHWQAAVQAHPEDAGAWVRCGMAHFRLGQVAASIAAFDRAEQVRPALTPYLWQRGLSRYYAGEFEAGAAQFEADLAVNGRDVEETVWCYLCLARSRSPAAARAALLPVGRDPRPVLRQVYRLFAGEITPQDLVQVGQQAGDRGEFYSALYGGLYCEVTGEDSQAQAWITRAVGKCCPDDYMWHLARVHGSRRGWLSPPSGLPSEGALDPG